MNLVKSAIHKVLDYNKLELYRYSVNERLHILFKGYKKIESQMSRNEENGFQTTKARE